MHIIVIMHGTIGVYYKFFYMIGGLVIFFSKFVPIVRFLVFEYLYPSRYGHLGELGLADLSYNIYMTVHYKVSNFHNCRAKGRSRIFELIVKPL